MIEQTLNKMLKSVVLSIGNDFPRAWHIIQLRIINVLWDKLVEKVIIL